MSVHHGRRALGLIAMAVCGLSGCGGDDATPIASSTPPAVRPGDVPAKPIESFRGAAGADRFTEVAHSVCATVLEQVGPLPDAKAKTDELVEYAASAVPAAPRLARAIGTLAQQRPESAAKLEPLRAAVETIERHAQPLANGDRSALPAVADAIATSRAVASNAGVPGCAFR